MMTFGDLLETPYNILLDIWNDFNLNAQRIMLILVLGKCLNL